jgi:hypothetical protein
LGWHSTEDTWFCLLCLPFCCLCCLILLPMSAWTRICIFKPSLSWYAMPSLYSSSLLQCEHHYELPSLCLSLFYSCLGLFLCPGGRNLFLCAKLFSLWLRCGEEEREEENRYVSAGAAGVVRFRWLICYAGAAQHALPATFAIYGGLLALWRCRKQIRSANAKILVKLLPSRSSYACWDDGIRGGVSRTFACSRALLPGTSASVH